MNTDAKVTIGAEGGDEVARMADRVLRPWITAADAAKSAVHGMGSAVASTFQSVVSDVARGVTAFAAFDFGSQIPKVIQYREEVSRLATAAGMSSEELRQKFAAQEAQTGQSRAENEKFAASFGKLTYNYRDAAGAAAALGDEAIASGRSLGDMATSGKAIYDLTGSIKNAPEILGRLRSQAEALKTIGGPDAARAQFEALGSVIAKLATETPEHVGRMTSAMLTLTQGLRPEQAEEAQSSVMGKILGDTRATERFLRSEGQLKRGESILDEHGQIKDLPEVMAKYQAAWRHGAGSEREARRLSRMHFGDLGGAAFMNADFMKGAGMGVSGGAAALAGAFLGGEEGERLKAQLAARGAQQDVTAEALPAIDQILNFARAHPVLAGAGALLAPRMAAKGMGWLVGKGMGWLVGKGMGALTGAGAVGTAGGGTAAGGLAASGGAAAGGTSALEAAAAGGWISGEGLATGGLAVGGVAAGAGAAALATLAGTAAILMDIGRDRDSMGREYRASHGGLEVLEAFGKAKRAASGVDDEDAPLVAYKAARSAGASAADAEEIARIIAKGIVQAPIQINVINSTGGPIEVLQSKSASNKSGQQ